MGRPLSTMQQLLATTTPPAFPGWPKYICLPSRPASLNPFNKTSRASASQVCKLLLDHESFTAVDAVDVFGRTALHHAARGGRVSDVLSASVSGTFH